MSKLDQIKALGAAKAASRNSSDGGVESRHADGQPTMPDPNGERSSDKAAYRRAGSSAPPVRSSIVGSKEHYDLSDSMGSGTIRRRGMHLDPQGAENATNRRDSNDSSPNAGAHCEDSGRQRKMQLRASAGAQDPMAMALNGYSSGEGSPDAPASHFDEEDRSGASSRTPIDGKSWEKIQAGANYSASGIFKDSHVGKQEVGVSSSIAPGPSDAKEGGKVKLQRPDRVSPDLGSQAKERPAESRTITSDSVATQREFRRPLAKDRHKTVTANRPWEAEGMSRASWYRRQRAKEQK
jgi:hypothetical protein